MGNHKKVPTSQLINVVRWRHIAVLRIFIFVEVNLFGVRFLRFAHVLPIFFFFHKSIRRFLCVRLCLIEYDWTCVSKRPYNRQAKCALDIIIFSAWFRWMNSFFNRQRQGGQIWTISWIIVLVVLGQSNYLLSQYVELILAISVLVCLTSDHISVGACANPAYIIIGAKNRAKQYVGIHRLFVNSEIEFGGQCFQKLSDSIEGY